MKLSLAANIAFFLLCFFLSLRLANSAEEGASVEEANYVDINNYDAMMAASSDPFQCECEKMVVAEGDKELLSKLNKCEDELNDFKYQQHINTATIAAGPLKHAVRNILKTLELQSPQSGSAQENTEHYFDASIILTSSDVKKLQLLVNDEKPTRNSIEDARVVLERLVTTVQY
jgi:hypothetical protein